MIQDKIKYITRGLTDAEIAYKLRDDGQGIYIEYWGVYGISKPTDDELNALDNDDKFQTWLQTNSGLELPTGEFIGGLPMAIQGDFDDLVESGDRGARVLARFISTSATINTASPKTQGAVMYLAGVPIPDERGDTQQLRNPILTRKQAQEWLATGKVSI